MWRAFSSCIQVSSRLRLSPDPITFAARCSKPLSCSARAPRIEDLEKELQTLVKKKYAAHAYPRTVHFVTELPKTSSGKVQRHLLRRGML